MTIQENVKLSDFNTFKTGGGARFFCIVKNIDDLDIARQYAKERNLRILFLGGGSNILVSDDGFDGLVIKNEIESVEILTDGCIRFGSGMSWDKAVSLSIDAGLFGMENMSYIPGTVGASVVGNIGAYGAEAKDFVKVIEVFDFDTGQTFFLTKDQCNFEYRKSFFKEKRKWFVLSVEFLLSNSFTANINYPDIQKEIENEGLKEFNAKIIRDIVIKIRKSKLPDMKVLGTAGSFFKNIITTKEIVDEIKLKYPETPTFDVGNDKKKIPLGFVLDKICNLKGFRKGNVGLYEKQALVIVNFGNASSSEIISFVDFIKKEVKDQINIEIEVEVEII